MRITKTALLVVAVIAAIVASSAAAMAVSMVPQGGEAKETSTGQGKGTGPNDPPPRPPWVKADGTIDKAQMPDCVPVGGSDGKPVMKNGKPHCIPKDELFDEPDPNVRGKTRKEIDAINRKNAEEAEEALEGDSANSLGDDDEEDPITEGKVIVEQGGAAAPK